MTNLAQRTVSGLIGVAVMLGMILWNHYSFVILFLLISVISLNEFYSLATEDRVKPQKWTGIICGIVIYLCMVANYFATDDSIFGSAFHTPTLLCRFFIPVLFLIFIFELYRKSSVPFINIGLTLLGIIYIPFALSLLLIITSGGDGGFHPFIMVGYLFILWIYDIGAYFGGKWFGKTKLFVRISPNKTWEGVAGGTICAFIMAHFMAMYVPNLSRLDWAVVTVIIIVTSTYGDLVESMFKRSLQIKDSGSAIPGHGGFLDRFDGLFFSAPFVFAYLTWVHA